MRLRTELSMGKSFSSCDEKFCFYYLSDILSSQHFSSFLSSLPKKKKYIKQAELQTHSRNLYREEKMFLNLCF